MGKKDPDMIKLNYSNQYEKSIVLTEYSICYRIFFLKNCDNYSKKGKKPNLKPQIICICQQMYFPVLHEGLK